MDFDRLIIFKKQCISVLYFFSLVVASVNADSLNPEKVLSINHGESSTEVYLNSAGGPTYPTRFIVDHNGNIFIENSMHAYASNILKFNSDGESAGKLNVFDQLYDFGINHDNDLIFSTRNKVFRYSDSVEELDIPDDLYFHDIIQIEGRLFVLDENEEYYDIQSRIKGFTNINSHSLDTILNQFSGLNRSVLIEDNVLFSDSGNVYSDYLNLIEKDDTDFVRIFKKESIIFFGFSNNESYWYSINEDYSTSIYVFGLDGNVVRNFTTLTSGDFKSFKQLPVVDIYGNVYIMQIWKYDELIIYKYSNDMN